MNPLEQQSLTSIFESMYMQHELEIEMQIWEYLDGQCTEEDRLRISTLIARDEVWRTKHTGIFTLHANLNANLELEHPSLRFSQNVMDVVSKEQIAPATKLYLNKWIIRGIAAFFIIAIGSLLLDVLSTTTISGSDRSVFPRFSNFSLPTIPGSSILYGFLLLNVLAGLILTDTLLRRKRRASGAS